MAAFDEPVDLISYLYLKKDNITNEALASNSDTEKVGPADDGIKNGVQYIYSILDEVIKGNIDINPNKLRIIKGTQTQWIALFVEFL